MSAIHDIELKGPAKKTYWIIVIVLIIGIPLQIFPYVYMISNSFKDSLEIIKLPPSFIPKSLNWINILNTFKSFNLLHNMLNTLVLCVMTIVVQVTISSLAAYSLSKLKPKGHNYVLLFFVGTLMISEQTLLFPTYIMMYNFPLIHVNLINSFIAPVLAWSAWGWAIFLFKGFFDSVPNELMESARIDGANSLYIFGKIILPLSKPVFAVIILNTFMAVYNTFVVPLLLLPEENNWTLMVRIYAAQEGRATWNEVIIMLTFATIPVLIIYMFAQKYIVQGINMSGIKG